MPRPICPIADGLINRRNSRRPVFSGEGGCLALFRALAAYRAVRWAAYVQQGPPDAEVTSIRRSSQTGLPHDDPQWVTRLAKKLHLDLTVRPRGHPPKRTKQERFQKPKRFSILPSNTRP